ncbi:hypothetical protein Asi03nite_02750 [Actinoplanes siamensis]|uniref:Uncharacterized protein n=1 Tax=Actinoplanes siamensis TaxID=1223317 RepID=A0A919K850_9ACTN|nr:hypothetical protein Asi03nite_02750 [Actinoplanes siamensis]
MQLLRIPRNAGEDSLRPAQHGRSVTKDNRISGIGLTLLIDSFGDECRPPRTDPGRRHWQCCQSTSTPGHGILDIGCVAFLIARLP